jgi:hypothetical protein
MGWAWSGGSDLAPGPLGSVAGDPDRHWGCPPPPSSSSHPHRHGRRPGAEAACFLGSAQACAAAPSTSTCPGMRCSSCPLTKRLQTCAAFFHMSIFTVWPGFVPNQTGASAHIRAVDCSSGMSWGPSRGLTSRLRGLGGYQMWGTLSSGLLAASPPPASRFPLALSAPHSALRLVGPHCPPLPFLPAATSYLILARHHPSRPPATVCLAGRCIRRQLFPAFADNNSISHTA